MMVMAVLRTTASLRVLSFIRAAVRLPAGSCSHSIQGLNAVWILMIALKSTNRVRGRSLGSRAALTATLVLLANKDKLSARPPDAA